jgi:hypothetical protein
MAEINLTQEEANILIAMEKRRANEDHSDFPMRGQSVTLPLQSTDKREQFLLDLSRARIDLQKVKMQNRGAAGGSARQTRSRRRPASQSG